jgi:hypothetical protein
VGTVVEFPSPRQRLESEPKPESARSVSRSILTCPRCACDFLAEGSSDGELTLTPLDEVPDLTDPDDDGLSF